MKKNKGFTLIELLIVVAIIGIIAAIAIPNLLDAIQRSRQKRSIGDLRNLAGAVQTFGTDYGGYPDAATFNGTDPSQSFGLPTYIDNGGEPAFCPDYIQACPAADGWQSPYQYIAATDSQNPNTRLNHVVAKDFGLMSMGSDQQYAAVTDVGAYLGGDAGTAVDLTAVPPLATASPTTGCYESDIIWINSGFIQVPDGKQKKCV